MFPYSARQILRDENTLSEIVQAVGRDALTEDQKVTLEIAKIIREDYLQQNAFSRHDYTCPLHKSVRPEWQCGWPVLLACVEDERVLVAVLRLSHVTVLHTHAGLCVMLLADRHATVHHPPP